MFYTMSCKTHTATIYVACVDLLGVEEICLNYCTRHAQDEFSGGLCVTVTPTKYVYLMGKTAGAAVGLINYPKYESNYATVRGHALALCERLITGLELPDASVVFPDETVQVYVDAS